MFHVKKPSPNKISWETFELTLEISFCHKKFSIKQIIQFSWKKFSQNSVEFSKRPRNSSNSLPFHKILFFSFRFPKIWSSELKCRTRKIPSVLEQSALWSKISFFSNLYVTFIKFSSFKGKRYRIRISQFNLINKL